MAWDLGLDRTVLRLIPKFIRNPIMYNWISSLVFPLKYINREFVIFALEKSVEAKISSQTQLLEDYLNTSFNSILPYPETDFIEIQHGTEYAQATFFSTEKDANIIPSTEGHAVLYSKQEVEVGLKVVMNRCPKLELAKPYWTNALS